MSGGVVSAGSRKRTVEGAAVEFSITGYLAEQTAGIDLHGGAGGIDGAFERPVLQILRGGIGADAAHLRIIAAGAGCGNVAFHHRVVCGLVHIGIDAADADLCVSGIGQVSIVLAA